MLHQINRRRGFSLIELLIVISIILIIITVAVPKFQKAQMGARELGAIKAIQPCIKLRCNTSRNSAGMPIHSRSLARPPAALPPPRPPT